MVKPISVDHMNNFAFLDDKHRVIFTDDVAKWADNFSIEKRRVALDLLPNEYRISTVFLGINYGFGNNPLWFETMVFKGDSNHDEEMQRYETWDEAVEGHREMVNKWSKKPCTP